MVQQQQQQPTADLIECVAAVREEVLPLLTQQLRELYSIWEQCEQLQVDCLCKLLMVGFSRGGAVGQVLLHALLQLLFQQEDSQFDPEFGAALVVHALFISPSKVLH